MTRIRKALLMKKLELQRYISRKFDVKRCKNYDMVFLLIISLTFERLKLLSTPQQLLIINVERSKIKIKTFCIHDNIPLT